MLLSSLVSRRLLGVTLRYGMAHPLVVVDLSTRRPYRLLLVISNVENEPPGFTAVNRQWVVVSLVTAKAGGVLNTTSI
jgi:hypothetical protein